MATYKQRTYSHYTKDGAILLGKHIQLARKNRKLTERDFADRLGVSPTTLRKVEKGDLKCELGIVLEAAALIGVNLFSVESHDSLTTKLESVNDKLALLPKAIRQPREVDDAF